MAPILPNIVYKVATGDVAKWREPLVIAMTRWDISTVDRAIPFLAQCAHESGGFKRQIEDLRYQASTLLRVFPRYFTASEAARMAFDERAIAERVYGGRMGNAIEGLGDGFKFRGRGLFQLTGRENYEACGRAMSLPLDERPDLLLEPQYAALSAGWYWFTRGCNDLADAGDFVGITRKINGGTNGLDDRELWPRKLQAAAAEA